MDVVRRQQKGHNASLPCAPSLPLSRRGKRMAEHNEGGHGEGAQAKEKEKDDDGFTTVPVKNGNAQSTGRGRKNRKGKNAAPTPKNLVTLVGERAQELRRDGYPQRCLCALAHPRIYRPWRI